MKQVLCNSLHLNYIVIYFNALIVWTWKVIWGLVFQKQGSIAYALLWQTFSNYYYYFFRQCLSCVLFNVSAHQVPLADLRLEIASRVLQVTTANREEWQSQVAIVQKATTVLKDRALRGHNNMSAQWDIIVRRSAIPL